MKQAILLEPLIQEIQGFQCHEKSHSNYIQNRVCIEKSCTIKES